MAQTRLTLAQVVADVQRKPGLSGIALGEIWQTVNVVHKDLGNQPWPWNYYESNVLVPAPYSTGTVSITDQTAVVTGVGTTWDSTWYGRRIRFGTNNLDYIISSISTPTSLTLAQPVNLGSNLTASGYTMYQDTYLYPTDYILGSDVALLQPVIRTRIPKIPRYKFEMIMNAGMRSFSTNITMFYCDQGQETSLNANVQAFYARYRFRLGPPPSGPAELRFCYHQMAADLQTSTTFTQQTVLLPEGYDEIISLAAASKLYDLYKMPGDAMAAKILADGKIRLLKRQVSTQTIDDVPEATFEMPDSSISQWGMSIQRMP